MVVSLFLSVRFITLSFVLNSCRHLIRCWSIDRLILARIDISFLQG